MLIYARNAFTNYNSIQVPLNPSFMVSQFSFVFNSIYVILPCNSQFCYELIIVSSNQSQIDFRSAAKLWSWINSFIFWSAFASSFLLRSSNTVSFHLTESSWIQSFRIFLCPWYHLFSSSTYKSPGVQSIEILPYSLFSNSRLKNANGNWTKVRNQIRFESTDMTFKVCICLIQNLQEVMRVLFSSISLFTCWKNWVHMQLGIEIWLDSD